MAMVVIRVDEWIDPSLPSKERTNMLPCPALHVPYLQTSRTRIHVCISLFGTGGNGKQGVGGMAGGACHVSCPSRGWA
jgi:hypothetical protein